MKTTRTNAFIVIGIASLAGVGLATAISQKKETVLSRPPLVAQSAKYTGNESAENIGGLRSLNDSYTSLAEYVLPAVVQIRSVTERASDSEGKRIPMQGSEGSGFIYREDGYVITNDHVISGAKEVTVILNDGKELQGTVVSAPEWDVAVIKVKSDNLPTLALADSKTVKPGQVVMAIGSPYGLENSVTFGNVSALGRENVVPDGLSPENARFYPNLIQTDAAINVGNSGGPLVNIDGQVIGMNSSIFTKGGGSNGIGFAIPSSQVKLLADILIAKGKVTRSMIGLYPRDLKPFEVKERNNAVGALVETVSPGSAGEKAGIKKGDLITRINDEPIKGQIDLRNAMLTNSPGTTVKVTYLRGSTESTVSVKLEEFKAPPTPKVNRQQFNLNDEDLGDLFGNGKSPNMDELRKKFQERRMTPKLSPSDPNADEESDVQPLRESDKPRLGVSIENLNSQLRAKHNIPAEAKGVVVTNVEEGSIAARYGLEVGDIIVSIDGKPTTSVQELTDAMNLVTKGVTKKIKTARYRSNGEMTSEKAILFK